MYILLLFLIQHITSRIPHYTHSTPLYLLFLFPEIGINPHFDPPTHTTLPYTLLLSAYLQHDTNHTNEQLPQSRRIAMNSPALRRRAVRIHSVVTSVVRRPAAVCLTTLVVLRIAGQSVRTTTIVPMIWFARINIASIRVRDRVA